MSENYLPLVMYKDQEGMPRAYAYAIDKDTPLDDVKELASNMLDAYIKSKPYSLSRDSFTMEIVKDNKS